MGSLSVAGRNVEVNAVAAVAVRGKLHSADPGVNGTANTIPGADQTIAWGAATNGIASLSAAVNFNVPAGTVAYVSFWSSDGATFYGSDDLSTAEVFAAAGTYMLTSATLTAS